MKKTLLTLALVAMTSVASYAQGTIAFGNSALTRVQLLSADGLSKANLDPALGIQFAVFVNGSDTAAGPVAMLGTTAGVIAAPSVYTLAGTVENTIVSLKIRAWEGSTANWQNAHLYFGETDSRQVTLGPTAGPGQVIWQTATGVNANRFTPLIVHIVPEPSTIALAVLGLGSVLLFRRRK